MIKNNYLDIARNDLDYQIASHLNQLYPDLKLDTIGLAYLTDFYFDARYPGDDFYTVSKDDFENCLTIMYDTISRLETLTQ